MSYWQPQEEGEPWDVEVPLGSEKLHVKVVKQGRACRSDTLPRHEWMNEWMHPTFLGEKHAQLCSKEVNNNDQTI